MDSPKSAVDHSDLFNGIVSNGYDKPGGLPNIDLQEEEQYKCTVCEESFTDEQLLTKHYKNHMEQNLFMCVLDDEGEDIDDEQVFLGDSQFGISTAIDRISQFECEVCHKIFSFKSSLTRHYSTHSEINMKGTSVEVKKHACCLCNKSFLHESQLRRHYRYHSKPHECDVCHKKFPIKGSLLTHYRTHLDKSSHICPVCFKSFTMKKDLKYHTLTHKEFQPRYSEDQDMVSANEVNDRSPDEDKSDNDSNSTDKIFQCDRCDKSFDSISKLSIHHAVHTQVKRHTCAMCFKSFTKVSHLQCHIRIHTGERPYPCNLCDRAFAEKGNLIKHQLRHERDAVKRPTSKS